METCRHCQRRPPRHRLGCPGSGSREAPICGHCSWRSNTHAANCHIVKRHLLYPDVALPLVTLSSNPVGNVLYQ